MKESPHELDDAMENEIVDFLRQLISTQETVIAVLQEKQVVLVKPEKRALETITGKEENILAELQKRHERRERILDEARDRNLPCESIQMLCEHLFPNRIEIHRLLDSSRQRSRQIRYLALTNWTMTQRSIVHLAQMLEMIETRGQGKTTYTPQKGKDASSPSGGGFVDKVA